MAKPKPKATFALGNKVTGSRGAGSIVGISLALPGRDSVLEVPISIAGITLPGPSSVVFVDQKTNDLFVMHIHEFR